MPCAPETSTHGHGGHGPFTHTGTPGGVGCAAIPTRAFPRPPEGHTHRDLAPEAAPVLQAQHAAAGLVTHRALGAHGQVPLQPLVRHGNLQTKQARARDSPAPHGPGALGQRCS